MNTTAEPKIKIPKKYFNEMIDWLIAFVQSVQTSYVEENLAEYMEREFILPKGESKTPGLFSFKRAPYLRRVAECLSFNSGYTSVRVIKTNQLGFTLIALALMNFCVKHGIGPGLYASGDQEIAQETFEKRWDSILSASGLADKIKAVVKKKHDKTTGDRRDVKSYAGTFFRAVGPNSESKLRSFPIRLAITEEVDVFPQLLKGKGNPLVKIARRLDSFGELRKEYITSTPKEKSTSQIEPACLDGDWELYHVPCPVCGHKQPLVWGGLKWDKNEDGSIALEMDDAGNVKNDPVYYECANPDCKAHWKNSDKFYFLRDEKAGGMDLPDGRHVFAEWIPTRRPKVPNTVSFHINALYSNFRSWLDIVLQFLRDKDDPIKFPDFVNDVLAETSETRVKTPEAHWLMARAESEWKRGDPAPKGVLFLTLAADVQADRIEAGIIGWGKNRESWILDYWVFEGATADIDSPCWKALDEKLEREYIRVDGVSLGRPIVSMIDAGYLQDQVNHFCAQYVYSPKGFDGVYPCVGKENLSNVWTDHINDIETPMIHFHDQRLKREIYSYLLREPPVQGAALPVGYIHFPQGYSEDWYKQLTAEEMHIETDRKGRKKYVITNAKQRRNEVLDVVKMNWGALYFAYLRFFEIRNKALKLQHRKEIEADWSVFWRLWDEGPGEEGEEEEKAV